MLETGDGCSTGEVGIFDGQKSIPERRSIFETFLFVESLVLGVDGIVDSVPVFETATEVLST